MARSDLSIEMGIRFEQERKRLKLTQVEISTRIGVKRLTISNYESGLRSPDAVALRHFADLGGDVLFVLLGHKVRYSDIERRLVELEIQMASLLAEK